MGPVFILQGFMDMTLDDHEDMLEIDILNSCKRDQIAGLRDLNRECKEALRETKYREN